ncbi:hypothetical protein [Vibrio maerlii]|uniref:hypothetical protein n=1 Tax=Vibrio maerlii TaxID=2231648 RepID=UPI0013DF897F|nr:hypothetical protein [Vibrio maerlii]
MVRLIAIGLLVAVAVLLIRYRTNEKIQKGVVIGVVSAFLLYTASLMITELMR